MSQPQFISLEIAQLCCRELRETGNNVLILYYISYLVVFKGAQSRLIGLKSSAWIFQYFVVCNPGQPSPSLTILVPLWFIIISLVFFYLCKVLFSGFLQFNGNFVDGQNNSKYRDFAPFEVLCSVMTEVVSHFVKSTSFIFFISSVLSLDFNLKGKICEPEHLLISAFISFFLIWYLQFPVYCPDLIATV